MQQCVYQHCGLLLEVTKAAYTRPWDTGTVVRVYQEDFFINPACSHAVDSIDGDVFSDHLLNDVVVAFAIISEMDA